MSLSATDLKDLIIQEFQNWDGSQNTPQAALTKYGQILADYIKANAELNYSWVAFSPPPTPTPDPVTTTTGKILSLTFALTPSNSSDGATAHTHFKNELIAGMTAATIGITDPTFLVTGTMAMGAGLSSLDIMSKVQNKVHPAAILALTTEIVRWTQSLTGAMVNGTHLIYTVGGVGTVTSIN